MSTASTASTAPSTSKTPMLHPHRIVDVHALHKSGTMFLYQFFRHLAKQQNALLLSENNDPADDYFDLAALRSAGASATEKTMAQTKAFLCRCPIRTFDVDEFRLEQAPQHRIFHLRDPRDILVSEYFSFGWIHTTQGTPLDQRRQEIQEMGVDEYVITQSAQSTWPLDQKYASLVGYDFDPELETVVKYEQMVTEFPKWCSQVVAAFGVRFPKMLTARLAWRYRNEFKTSGETMQHKRRITPGDFRDKLKPDSIRN